MSNFYKDLSSFKDFNHIFDEKHYSDVPEDWWVVITDIKNSTSLVEQGRYKDVNIIGAACIGACEEIGDFPFVFGGDGSSFLIPPQDKDLILDKFLDVQVAARSRFNIDLRIGSILIEDLKSLGGIIKVAKYELSSKKYLAKFTGGGLSLADKLIKENIKYQIESNKKHSVVSFNNLSCRWEPVKNSKGVILTLLIQADNFKTYSEVLSTINNITGNNSTSLNPIKTKYMNYKNLRSMFKDESKFDPNFFSLNFLKRGLEIILAYFLFNLFRKFSPSFIADYTLSMERYSDYRKFDDTLRMVIDCTKEQSQSIISYLEENTKLIFGSHKSESALMTCLVKNLSDGGHIHFIDGNDGGYSMAAKQMKNKIKKA